MTFRGERVLAAYSTATPLNWLVVSSARARGRRAALRRHRLAPLSCWLAGLALALLAALLLARLMVVPVRALSAGAARIGAGPLDHRIKIKTGDELEALGDQLNDMAAKLRAPTPRSSARWRSARGSWRKPTWRSRASSRRRATTCASRCTP